MGGPPLAYAAAPNQIDVVNALTNTHTATVVTPNQIATALAITPDARFVLAVLRPFFGAALASVRLGAVPAQSSPPPGPELIAISVATNTIVPGVTLTFQSPVAIAIAPGGATAYVVDNDDGRPHAIPVGIQESTGPDGIALIKGPPMNLPYLSSVSDEAISPDNHTLYAVGEAFSGQATLEAINLATGAPTRLAVPNGSTRIAVTPDGSTAYLAVGANFFQSVAGPGFVEQIGLPSLTDEGPISGPSGEANTVDPVAETIATRPDGTSSLWVADQQNSDVYEIPVPTPPSFQPTTNTAIALFTAPAGLAATPDGSSLEITTGRAVVAQASLPSGPASTCSPLSACPPGNGAIVITPDQAPVAAFAVTPGQPGTPTSFDASGSTLAYGSLATYQWSFGDRSSATTSVPTVTHVYAAAGPETVSLVETTEAGTSAGLSPPSTVFTGHTMTRLGGPEAGTSQAITIPPGPPAPAPGVPPTLTLDPTVGPLGTVVAATGAGFPKNATVTLSWNPGIGTATASTDANGSFVQRILIMPNDRLGHRVLIATAPGLSQTVQAQFLVEPLSVDPGGKDQILFRR